MMTGSPLEAAGHPGREWRASQLWSSSGCEEGHLWLCGGRRRDASQLEDLLLRIQKLIHSEVHTYLMDLNY